jgi:tetratricopeptide (TPR) repeat protein
VAEAPGPTSAAVIAGGIGLVAATAALVAARRRAGPLLAAWISYAALIAPVVGIFQAGPHFAADRYTYLACVPWALVAGASLARARAFAWTAAAALIAMLAALTVRQVQVWHDEAALWEQAVAAAPSFAAHYNRGHARQERGELSAAVEDYSLALQRRSHDPALVADACNNRAMIREMTGDRQGALADYAEAIRAFPSRPLPYANRGNLRLQLGERAGATEDFATAGRLLTEALARNPNDLTALVKRAEVYWRLGRIPEAAADIRRALKVAPPEWPRRADLEGTLRELERNP